MQRILFAITIFALSFIVTAQLLAIFRDEATTFTWVVLFFSIAGFVGMLFFRARGAARPPNS